MKIFDASIIIVMVCVLVACGYSMLRKAKPSIPPDNAFEENLETILEKQLGMPEGSIDLSPDTPDVK